MRRHTQNPLPILIRYEAPSGLINIRRLQGPRCVLGAGSGADLVIEGPTVSRAHVELEVVPEGVVVRDLSSRNGTFYLGQRVQHMVVHLGARISLGKTEITIEPDLNALASQAVDRAEYGQMVTAAPEMRKLFALLERLEGSLVNVLIEGESGTGKELIARAIHQHSPVCDGPLVPINCGAIQRDLVQSELFGHSKGAFTGAVMSRKGAFEAANGGTLFLDEIGELPLEIQPVLLRALEERSITPVGESMARSVRVRLLAATNRRLRELVDSGQFREDLYYRLMVVRISVPALRERRADIPLLADLFAKGLGANKLPDAVVARLEAYDFPGNVRELRHAVEAYLAVQALPFASGAEEQKDKLEQILACNLDITRPHSQLKEEFLELFTRAYLSRLLAHAGGNVSHASRISGMDRSYLSRLVHRLGVNRSGSS